MTIRVKHLKLLIKNEILPNDEQSTTVEILMEIDCWAEAFPGPLPG